LKEVTMFDDRVDRITELENQCDAIKHMVANGDMYGAAWGVNRMREMLEDPKSLAQFGFKLDHGDIMRPRLVKLTLDEIPYTYCGKFEGETEATHRLYHLWSEMGSIEDLSNDYGCWWLMQVDETCGDDGYLFAHQWYILFENTDGFVHSFYYETEEDARAQWETIIHQWDEEDEE
jgi:hypothetical protein